MINTTENVVNNYITHKLYTLKALKKTKVISEDPCGKLKIFLLFYIVFFRCIRPYSKQGHWYTAII